MRTDHVIGWKRLLFADGPRQSINALTLYSFYLSQKQKPGSVSASALICITTDLGDAFLTQDVSLLVTLRPAQHEQNVFCQERLQWHGGKRELPISLGPLPGKVAQMPLVMEVTASNSNSTLSDSLLDQRSMPLVVSSWSAPFGGPQSLVAEKLIERRLRVNQSVELRIW